MQKEWDRPVSVSDTEEWVWNPNTQTRQKYMITQIVRAPDTFYYGYIEEDGKLVRVYSSVRHGWTR